MSTRCPDPTDLAALLDREQPERRAEELRAHVRECSVCSARVRAHEQLIADLRAPAVHVAIAPISARILARLDEPSRTRRWWPGGVALAGAMVLIALFVWPTGQSETMQARGGHDDRLDRLTSASLYVISDRAHPVASGAELPVDAKLVLGYRHLERRKPIYLIAFAIDSANDIHWLYPAFERATDDPEALELPVADRETLLPETVVLDNPARGPLRVVTVIGEARPRISTIEALGPAALTGDALRARWPGALVTETIVSLRSAP